MRLSDLYFQHDGALVKRPAQNETDNSHNEHKHSYRKGKNTMNSSRRQSRTRRTIFRIRHVVIALSAIFFSYALSFAMSGSGTAGDPYIVTNYADLEAIGTGGYTFSLVYTLANDIDASASATENAGAGFVPIGNTGGGMQFGGTFHGVGHAVNNLYISRSGTNYIGLFGYTLSTATIDNLGVTNAQITGSQYVGGVVGYSQGPITNCYVTGTVTGNSENGGVVGYNGGTTSDCYMSGTVTNSGGGETGGIAGLNGGIITKCYMSGSMTSSSNQLGGIAGISNGTITDCYETGSVSGTGYVGGIAGYNYGGGITVNYCYAAGSVSGSSNFGGLVGGGSGTVNNSYWDKTTTGQTTSAGGEATSYGKITSDMKIQSTFVGWSSTIWNIGDGINNGYPYLNWQNPGGTPLPVELTSFIATSSNSTATLAWKTATEVNNYGFDVERRTIQGGEGRVESVDWKKIGFAQGSGTSSISHQYSFSDPTLAAGIYAYRLKQVDNGGAFKYSAEADVTIEVPRELSLGQNYPNPFNPSTTIEFTLAEDSHVSLKVFDMLGREVMTLVNGVMKAGEAHSVTFDASHLSSGIYFYRLETNQSSLVKRLALMK
jgi:Secretion system C-terminal sorting domain/The GLUG motif